MAQSSHAEISSVDAFEQMKNQSSAQLIDVRTPMEWSSVGIADLANVGRRTLLVSWQKEPGAVPEPDFVSQVAAELAKVGAHHNAPLYVICRSGARSRAAADALQAAGFQNVINVADGFEGNGVQKLGWKNAKLPTTVP